MSLCPECGSALPPDAPAGLCPRCVATAFLGDSSGAAAGFFEEEEPLRDSGEKVGPYEVLEPIGEGGFGIVYRAEQRWPIRRTVALKLIKPGMDSKAVLARFEAERQALGMMEHPNIARVLDVGMTPEGRPYFAMDLVQGEPLTTACERRNLGLSERLELFLQLCGALEHAHAKGVIHRDIKPSNVLVAEREGGLKVTIIDFGIAKALGAELTTHTLYTNPRQLLGTPEYMSPEQALSGGLDVDTRTDVYSLGALLYELLTGSPPVSLKAGERASMLDWVRAIREQEPEAPSRRLRGATRAGQETRALRRRAGDELDWVVLKALAKDRERRYQTVRELSEDLRRYLADETVLARPPSLSYAGWRFLRRHRVPVVAGLITLAAIVAAAVVSLWMAVKAERAAVEVRQAFSMADSAASVDRDAESYGRVMARLCRALRTDPENDEARLRLLTLMAEAPVGVLDARSLMHFDTVWKARFLPPDDGRILTAASRTGTLALWRCADGEVKRERSFVLPGALNAFDVSRDGRWALSATATNEGSVARVWSLNGAEPRTKEFRVVDGPGFVSEMVFSPDGETLYSASTKGELCAWKAATGECQWEWKSSVPLRSVAVSNDGRWVAAGHEDKHLSLHAAATGALVWREEMQRFPVTAVGFSIDDRYALAMGGDTFATRTEVELPAGQARTKARYEQHFRVKGFAQDPTGERVATGGSDGWVRLRPAAGGFIDSIEVAGPVQSLAFDRSGDLLAVGTREPHPGVALLNGRTGVALRHPLTLARGATEMNFSEDGKRMLVVSQTSDVLCFDIRPRAVKAMDRDVGPGLVDAGFLADGRSVAWMQDGQLRRWDAEGKELLPSLPTGRMLDWKGPAAVALCAKPDGQAVVMDLSRAVPRCELKLPAAVALAKLSVNGEYALLVSNDAGGWLGVFDTREGRAKAVWKLESVAVRDGVVSANGAQVVCVMVEGGLRFFDLKPGGEVTTREVKTVPEPVLTLAMNASGDRVVTGSEDALLRVWDVATAQQAAGAASRTPRHWDHALPGGHEVQFSHDGSRFFSYRSRDLRLCCFYAADGGVCGPQMPHLQPVTQVAVSPDDRLLVAADANGAVALWHLGRQLQISSPWQQPAPVVALDFSARGDRVLVALQDGRVRVLPVPPLDGPPLPESFLRFAEGFGLWRLTAEGSSQMIGYDVYEKARQEVLALPDEPGNRQRAWIKWLASDPEERGPWPE
ncbi:MAG: protein kinase [Verrucomicrobiaceae bacterium]|nr:protein kinase [Verrucomicrobiaceae bacterium]